MITLVRIMIVLVTVIILIIIIIIVIIITAQIIATSRDVTSKISEISDRSRPELSQFSDPALGPLLLCVLLPSQEHASWLPRRPAPRRAPQLAKRLPKKHLIWLR